MKRPGPAGLLVLLAFAVIAIVEFRTVFALVGIEVPAVIYLTGATSIAVLIAFAVWLRSDTATAGTGLREPALPGRVSRTRQEHSDRPSAESSPTYNRL